MYLRFGSCHYSELFAVKIHDEQMYDCGSNYTWSRLDETSSVLITANFIYDTRIRTPGGGNQSCLFTAFKPAGFDWTIAVLKADIDEDCNLFLANATCNRIKQSDGKILVANQLDATSLKINIPPIVEMKAVVTLFSNWDNLTNSCPLAINDVVFRCANDRCIYRGLRCDGLDNCGDASDESSCAQLEHKKDDVHSPKSSNWKWWHIVLLVIGTIIFLSCCGWLCCLCCTCTAIATAVTD